MDDFWNSNCLKPPPVDSFKCKSAIDIKNVISILDNAIDTFIIPNSLRVESNIMRRVIYRLKLQFRLDKGFKLFENTNRNLNQLFSFNITRDLMFLLDKVPKKYNKDFYFPSKQMLEYVLVRLQGYSQVCSRVVESAFHTAILMKGRVRLGHQWEIAAVCIAICSRIWQICKYLTSKCCLVYTELLPLLDKLEITGSKWLPDNYQFPNDLTEWLNYDWLLDKPDVILQLPLELPIFSLLDDDENDVQYYGRYKINKNRRNTTIVIPDDSDEDDCSDTVKFVCSFNKSYVELKKSQVKKLKEKRKPAYNSITENATTSDYDFLTAEPIKNPLLHIIDSDDDADVQIIEPTKSPYKKSLNITSTDNGVEVIEINDSFTLDEDVGEIISRDNLKHADKYEFSDEEAIEKEESLDDSLEKPGKSKIKKKKKKKKKKVPKEGDIPKCVTLKGFEFEINSPETLERFLERENCLRDKSIYHPELIKKTKKDRTCISSHLTDQSWYYLSYEIKYYIAVAYFIEEDSKNNLLGLGKAKYIRKAQEMLIKILDVDVNIKNKEYKPENFFDEQLTLSVRRYFINSLKTLPDLQIFLKEESELRKSALDNSFFSKLDDKAWQKVCNEIQYLLVVASQKPIKSIMYIKKAQLLLRLLCFEYVSQDDLKILNSDDEVELLRKESKDTFENMYKSVPIGTDQNSLFDFVREIKNYIVPHKKYKIQPKLSKKQKRELKKIEDDMKQNASQIELEGQQQSNKRKLELNHMTPINKKRKLQNHTL